MGSVGVILVAGTTKARNGSIDESSGRLDSLPAKKKLAFNEVIKQLLPGFFIRFRRPIP